MALCPRGIFLAQIYFGNNHRFIDMSAQHKYINSLALLTVSIYILTFMVVGKIQILPPGYNVEATQVAQF